MKFKEIEISKIKNLDSTELVNLYKETRVWFQEGYDQDPLWERKYPEL